jgi:hypothetical protein
MVAQEQRRMLERMTSNDFIGSYLRPFATYPVTGKRQTVFDATLVPYERENAG